MCVCIYIYYFFNDFKDIKLELAQLGNLDSINSKVN